MPRLKRTLYYILAVVSLIIAIGAAGAISRDGTITITRVVLIITGIGMFGFFAEASDE